MGWLFNRLPAPLWGLLSNDVLACWGSPWRGSKEARAPTRFLELGVPATVSPEVRDDAMAVVMIGVDPHKASHTAVAICAGVASLPSAMRARRSTSAWLAARASAVKRGRLARMSPSPN